MIYRKWVYGAAILLSLLIAREARAEPLRVKSPTTCTTQAGSVLEVPVDSIILHPPDWLKLDTEVKRLQETETRLTAENESLRKSNGWAGWKTVAAATLVGIAVGAYAFR